MPKFSSRKIAATQGAIQMIEKGLNAPEYLARHFGGDWGDISDHDKQENEFALSRHLRILSAYETPQGRLWIITEADRSVTTLLKPDEY